VVQVVVRENNIDQALKALKKKMQREGIFREMKLRAYYEKPSERRKREKAEALRRARKLLRKTREGGGAAPRAQAAAQEAAARRPAAQGRQEVMPFRAGAWRQARTLHA